MAGEMAENSAASKAAASDDSRDVMTAALNGDNWDECSAAWKGGCWAVKMVANWAVSTALQMVVWRVEHSVVSMAQQKVAFKAAK
jgi:hypothetical protein